LNSHPGTSWPAKANLTAASRARRSRPFKIEQVTRNLPHSCGSEMTAQKPSRVRPYPEPSNRVPRKGSSNAPFFLKPSSEATTRRRGARRAPPGLTGIHPKLDGCAYFGDFGLELAGAILS
jgi:hypothetical protein